MKTERELFEEWYEENNDFLINTQFLMEGSRYLDRHVRMAWLAWQASTSRQGYKLVPITPTDEMIVAIENKVQEQLDASAITADMFRLDGERIFDAMIEATP